MKFFVLQPTDYRAYGTTEYCEYKPVDCSYAPKCETCGKYIGCIQWLPPFRVKLETIERRFDDVVWGPGDIFLVSERYIEMWKSHRFTGIDAFDPVEVVKIKRHKSFNGMPPPYYRVTIPYGETSMDVKSSHFIYRGDEPICPDCLTGPIIDSIHALAVDETTWKGEDIFRLRGCPGDIIITERVANCLIEHNMTNCKSILLDEYRWIPATIARNAVPPENTSGQAER